MKKFLLITSLFVFSHTKNVVAMDNQSLKNAMPLLVGEPSKLIVTDDPVTAIQYLSKKTNCLAISTSGNINPGITFANKKNDNQWKLSKIHDQSVWSIAINATNDRLISGESGYVTEWDITKQKSLVKIQTNDQNTSYKNKCIRCSPTDNDLFAAAVNNFAFWHCND